MNYWRGSVKQPNTKNVEITSLAPHFSSYIASRRLYLKSGSKLSFMLVLLYFCSQWQEPFRKFLVNLVPNHIEPLYLNVILKSFSLEGPTTETKANFDSLRLLPSLYLCIVHH
jgi:hypothetical protein